MFEVFNDLWLNNIYNSLICSSILTLNKQFKNVFPPNLALFKNDKKHELDKSAPSGIRTRVNAVTGHYPRPLDYRGLHFKNLLQIFKAF